MGKIDDYALFFSFFRLKFLKPLQIKKTQRFCGALVVCFILIYWLVLNFFGSPKSRGKHKYENTYFRSKSPFFSTFPTSGRMLLCDVMWCIYDVIIMMLYDVIWEKKIIIRRKSLLSGLFAYGSPKPGSPGPFPTSPSTFETGFEQLASCACQPSKKKKEKITGSLFFSLFCKNASPTKNDQTWPGLRPEWIKLPYTTVDHHKTSYNII